MDHGVTSRDALFPITFIAAGLIFFIIAVTGKPGGRTAVLSAAIAAMAAPMVFELPFDLIVMARTYPPIPPNPALYRAVFFVPLFLIEVTTLALLAWSPMVRLTRATFYSLCRDAGRVRSLGPGGWIRIPVRPTPLRPQRGIEAPRVRDHPDPVPAA